MNNLIDTVEYFLIITAELVALFLGISTLVALILLYIPPDKLRQWLSRRGLWGNFLGSLVGALTPFCACSTIPMTLGMLNAGAPFGPVISFVIASPLLNPIIISMIVAMMGWKAALLYFSVTFVGSMFFGTVLEKAGGMRYVKNVRIKKKECCSNEEEEKIPATFSGKLKKSFFSAWDDFKGVMLFLLIGVAVGAVIYGYIPETFIVKIAGPDNPFAIPVAAVVGVPLYIRAETAIPIGLALSQKGMNMGAVIALIIGGAGMAIPEMSMLAAIFRKRLVAAIAGIIFLTAVAGGYVFNAFF